MTKLTKKVFNIFHDLRNTTNNVDRFFNLASAIYKVAMEASTDSFRCHISNQNECNPYALYDVETVNVMIVEHLNVIKEDPLSNGVNIHTLRLMASSKLLYLLLKGLDDLGETGKSGISIIDDISVLGPPNYVSFQSRAALEPILRNIAENIRIDLLHLKDDYRKPSR